jgi:hypothetical protein
MTYSADDIYTPYEQGLRELLNRLDTQAHPSYHTVQLLQQRLSDNIATSRRYGDTQTRRTERSDIILQLDQIAMAELNTSFSDLSGLNTSHPPEPSTWSFTDAETDLRERILDANLRASLTAIRYAVEYIWDASPVRVVHNSETYSATHYKRLIELAARLLLANGGRHISSQELYLLLASIYLHNIGIQCDITRWPGIKNRAEKLGAAFDTTFPPNRESTYTHQQQQTIRHNHHYLSAAWIDYASRTGETDLGPAAMTIPRDLVPDLIDICKYYTHLSLNDCPSTFRFDTNGRKQLITALLRFIHELDLEKHCVPSDSLIDETIEPGITTYLWLHQRAKITFPARNLIRLTVSLHPDDVTRYGSYVYSTFISEFQSRNTPTLSILSRHGIPLTIDPESRIETDTHTAPLPAEIVQALHTMHIGRSPLKELADEIRIWLQAMNYEVTPPQQRNQHTVDMLASIDLGLIQQRILIRCIDGQIKPSDVSNMESLLDRRTPQGWLISERRVSDLARRADTPTTWVEIFSLAEVLQQKIWGPYFDMLTAMNEREHIATFYVDPGCHIQSNHQPESRPQSYTSLDHYVDTWLLEHSRMPLAILGESGSGKTWFCRHYAYRQLKRYLKDPMHERLPLLINLRNFPRAIQAQQLINEALLDQYHLSFIGNTFDIFDKMNRRGKLLLILDGLDEMVSQPEEQESTATFWNLADLMHNNSKVILTSRSASISCLQKHHHDHRASSSGKEDIQAHRQGVGMLTHPTLEAISINRFDTEQVRQAVIKRLDKQRGLSLANRMLATPMLVERVRIPVQLELLLNALDHVNDDMLQHPAHIYLYATRHTLLDAIETRHLFRSNSDKLYFLCELAWEMVRTGLFRIHYTHMPPRIRNFFAHRIRDQHEIDVWDYDLRKQSYLQRTVRGYYEFAHRTLAEYFVAVKFAAELGCLHPAVAQAYQEADGKPCTLPIARKSLHELAQTFGSSTLKEQHLQTVCEVLPGLLAPDTATHLRELVDEAMGSSSEDVRYVGKNAALLLEHLMPS